MTAEQIIERLRKKGFAVAPMSMAATAAAPGSRRTSALPARARRM